MLARLVVGVLLQSFIDVLRHKVGYLGTSMPIEYSEKPSWLEIRLAYVGVLLNSKFIFGTLPC